MGPRWVVRSRERPQHLPPSAEAARRGSPQLISAGSVRPGECARACPGVSKEAAGGKLCAQAGAVAGTQNQFSLPHTPEPPGQGPAAPSWSLPGRQDPEAGGAKGGGRGSTSGPPAAPSRATSECHLQRVASAVGGLPVRTGPPWERLPGFLGEEGAQGAAGDGHGQVSSRARILPLPISTALTPPFLGGYTG